MGILQGTTPELILFYKGVDLRGKTVEVYVRSNKRTIKITGDRLRYTVDDTGTYAYLQLSQLETLAAEDKMVFQSRWMDENGHVEGSTPVVTRKVNDLIWDKEIEYRGDDTDGRPHD